MPKCVCEKCASGCRRQTDFTDGHPCESCVTGLHRERVPGADIAVMVPVDMLASFLTQKQVNQFHDLYQFLTEFMFRAEVAYEAHTGMMRVHRDRAREELDPGHLEKGSG